MGALENQLRECDKEILIEEIMKQRKHVSGLIDANNDLLERSREIARESEMWHELALTSGRTLSRVRAEINELSKSVDSLGRTPPGPAARVALLQGMVARLTAAIDGKD